MCDDMGPDGALPALPGALPAVPAALTAAIPFSQAVASGASEAAR